MSLKMLLIAKLLLIVTIIPLIQMRSLRSVDQNNQTINESSIRSLSIANNDFAFKIFKLLSNEGENDVMSPLSINTAFSILMNGAENETLNDMRSFLEYKNNVSESTINEGFKAVIQKYKRDPQPSSSNFSTGSGTYDWGNNPARLNIANRIFRNESTILVPNYEETVKEYFNADIQSADFKNNAVEETKKVNDWVKNVTNDKITKIFDKIEEDTSFVIINALHFKGQWWDDFYPEATNQSDFYNNGNTTSVRTDFMYNKEFYNYYESQLLDCQFLELNYYGDDSQQSNFTFVVVLPRQRNGLTALKENLNPWNLRTALNTMRPKETELFLPKFKVETEYDLVNGISPKPHFLTSGAKFSRLSTQPNVVAEVKHKVYIDVNEKGTEAAAVTAIRAVPLSARFEPEPKIFRADHPFLYFIRDRSNDLILFIGQINKF